MNFRVIVAGALFAIAPTAHAQPELAMVIPPSEWESFAARLAASSLPGTWRQDLGQNLPPGIRVFEFRRASPPLRLWLAAARNVGLDWSLATITPARAGTAEKTSAMAKRSNAFVAINAGYFSYSGSKVSSVSLIVQNGRLTSSTIETVKRGEKTFYPVRAAFGVDGDGKFSAVWAYNREENISLLPSPLPNTQSFPAPLPELSALPRWHPREASGGGPMLLYRGEPQNTWEREVFFGSGVSSPEVRDPTTAIGATSDGTLVMVVADGRQAGFSVGINDLELIAWLQELDVVEAIALDGGGSSTFVVNGLTMNNPSDAAGERPVTSAFALLPTQAP